MRGTWISEGDTYINSTIDGRDGYDLIEWIATLPWISKRFVEQRSYASQPADAFKSDHGRKFLPFSNRMVCGRRETSASGMPSTIGRVE
jgi:hypothetical protein